MYHVLFCSYYTPTPSSTQVKIGVHVCIHSSMVYVTQHILSSRRQLSVEDSKEKTQRTVTAGGVRLASEDAERTAGGARLAKIVICDQQGAAAVCWKSLTSVQLKLYMRTLSIRGSAP